MLNSANQMTDTRKYSTLPQDSCTSSLSNGVEYDMPTPFCILTSMIQTDRAGFETNLPKHQLQDYENSWTWPTQSSPASPNASLFSSGRNISNASSSVQQLQQLSRTHNFPQYLAYFAVLELIGLTVLTHLSHLVKLFLTVVIAVIQGVINISLVQGALDYYDERTYGRR